MNLKIGIICGSPVPNISFFESIKHILLTFDEIYAVDKGLELCHTLNLPVTRIIGDFDSVDPEILSHYPVESHNRFPKEKNASDTEIALIMALKKTPDRIYLLNASEGRLDHYLFNILLLFQKPETIRLITPLGTCWALNASDSEEVNLPENTTFSVIPLTNCEKVTITGGKYPLNATDLTNSTLTLSNVALSPIKINYTSGKLLFFADICLI